MKENQKEAYSNNISLLIYSKKAVTDFSQVTRKGYAGKTRRLDILVRTLFLILNNEYIIKTIKTIEIVMYGEPYSPLNITIPKNLWENFNGTTEGDQMVFFAKRILNNNKILKKRELTEVIKYYQQKNYIPVLLTKEGDYTLEEFFERVFNENQDYIVIVGSDEDPPREYIHNNPITVSLGQKNYLLSHVLLYFFNVLLKKKRIC